MGGPQAAVRSAVAAFAVARFVKAPFGVAAAAGCVGPCCWGHHCCYAVVATTQPQQQISTSAAAGVERRDPTAGLESQQGPSQHEQQHPWHKQFRSGLVWGGGGGPLKTPPGFLTAAAAAAAAVIQVQQHIRSMLCY